MGFWFDLGLHNAKAFRRMEKNHATPDGLQCSCDGYCLFEDKDECVAFLTTMCPTKDTWISGGYDFIDEKLLYERYGRSYDDMTEDDYIAYKKGWGSCTKNAPRFYDF